MSAASRLSLGCLSAVSRLHLGCISPRASSACLQTNLGQSRLISAILASSISSSSASAASEWLSAITSALSTHSARISHGFLSERWARRSFLPASRTFSGSASTDSHSSRKLLASITHSSLGAARPPLVVAAAMREGCARSCARTTTLPRPCGSFGVSPLYSITSFVDRARFAAGSPTSTVADLSSLRRARATASLPPA